MNQNEDIEMLSPNQQLAEQLQLIGIYYTMAKDTYRAKSFLAAADKIAFHDNDILSGAQARKEISGIGDSIASAIDEYLTTGNIDRLSSLETNFKEARDTITYFTTFYGIGPVTAAKFYNTGYRTLEDLWFNAALTESQKQGILWREHIAERIPHEEIDIISTVIGSIFDQYGIKWSITGSYRRQEPTSGDVDVLIERRPDLNMNGIVELLEPYLPVILSKGEKKLAGIFRLSDDYFGHRIDIRLIDPESWPFALLYFTGSQKVNILMRKRAIEFGMKLSEYGLFDNMGNPQYAENERDIFNILQIKYLEPIERTKTISSLTPI